MDLVIIPFHDFKKGEQQGFRDRDNHFISLLCKRKEGFDKILIIDRPASLLETFWRWRDWHSKSGKLACKGSHWMLRVLEDNVYVLDFLDPAIFHPLLLRRLWWNSAYQNNKFHNIVIHILGYLKFDYPTILLHHPFGVKLVEKLHYRRFIFDISDNFMKMDFFLPIAQKMKRQYEIISSKADSIITVSQQAKENIFNNDPKVVVITNGVDPEFLRHPQHYHNYRELKNSRKVKITYIGTLAPQRIDVELLLDTAQISPDVDFFLFGPVTNNSYFSRLRRAENISFGGNIHYDYVPSILRDSDICMIPHRVGPFENDGDAIKSYEYIAAQKPVISTKILGSERFASSFKLITDYKEFRSAINEIKGNNFATSYPADILKGWTWDDKFDDLLQILKG
jgi:teichuronic acid biosynthesis glycosyltransferase TuaH